MSFKRFFLHAALVLTASMAFGATAAPVGCPQHFAYGRMPAYTVASFTKNTQLLCNDGYAVLYSGQTRTPLWAGEYLTPARMTQARRMKRDSEFFEDTRVAGSWRSLLSDYVRSGYDRGHIAPSGDMPTATAQAQSFSLTNIVPQNSTNNRGVWANLESTVRDYAQTRPVYVITGPLFLGQQIGFLKGRVAVPTHLYKIVYDPGLQKGVAFVVANQANAPMRQVSVGQLAQQSKLDYGVGNPALLTLDVSMPKSRATHSRKKNVPALPWPFGPAK